MTNYQPNSNKNSKDKKSLKESKLRQASKTVYNKQLFKMDVNSHGVVNSFLGNMNTQEEKKTEEEIFKTPDRSLSHIPSVEAEDNKEQKGGNQQQAIQNLLYKKVFPNPEPSLTHVNSIDVQSFSKIKFDSFPAGRLNQMSIHKSNDRKKIQKQG